MSNQIKKFDEFVNEAKKEKWIGKIDMQKDALKKSLGKKEIDMATLNKEEKKLEKKDKDKKKPGLQLDAKDAKKRKRIVLAKNLMKASGAIDEAKKNEIADVKNKLVEIHQVVQKMIKQTSAKK